MITSATRLTWRWDEEFALDPSLIVGGSPLVFTEANRLKSEGIFRIAVAGPLAAICVILALKDGSVWWLFGTLVCAVLWGVGHDLLSAVQRQVWDAMHQGMAPLVSVRQFVEVVQRQAREVVDRSQ